MATAEGAVGFLEVLLMALRSLLIQKLVGDAHFNDPNLKMMEFLAKDSDTKTFLYQFDHHSEHSVMELTLNSKLGREGKCKVSLLAVFILLYFIL